MQPLNDKLKIEILPDGPFTQDGKGVEKGIVVQVPDKLSYFGFHSFAFESSLADNEKLKEVLAFYEALKGKLVFWEQIQDRGRRFREGDKEYAFINMTDIIAYSDDPNINVDTVDQTGSAGSFNLS